MYVHVESTHGDLEAVALLAKEVLGGDLDVLEGDHARVGAALAHVDLLLAADQARRVAVDDEAGQALRLRGVRVGPSEHEEPVRVAAVLPG